MAKIKGVLIDVGTNKAEARTLSGELSGYYRALCCDTITVAYRKIGGKPFLIICDDDGLLKDYNLPSAVDSDNRVQLVGNLFVVQDNPKNGEFCSLTDEECQYVLNHVARLADGTPIITKCDY